MFSQTVHTQSSVRPLLSLYVWVLSLICLGLISWSHLLISPGMNEWVAGWMRKNWRTSEGKEPENIDLIKLVHYKATHRPAKVEVREA